MEPINGVRTKSAIPSFSTHEPLFRQGHVGDLNSKTKIEIKELLERQEKLLANRQFILKLPDKGEKIKSFAASLRNHLHQLEYDEFNGDKTDSLNNSSESNEAFIPTISEDCDLLNKTKDYVKTVHPTENILESNLSIIEKGFSDLAIHEGPHYDVVKKAAERPKQSKFKLNRLSEAKSMKSNESLQLPSTSSGLVTTHQADPKLKDDGDLSAASIRDPKTTSMLISIEESRMLYNKQQAIIKEQHGQLAAERILLKYAAGGDHCESSWRSNVTNNDDRSSVEDNGDINNIDFRHGEEDLDEVD